MNDRTRDNIRLVELIQETAKALNVPPREVRSRDFKEFALPRLEDEGNVHLFERIKKQSAGTYNQFRNAHVDWEVTNDDVEGKRDRLVSSIKRRDHNAQTFGALQDARFEEMLTRVFKGVKFEGPKRAEKAVRAAQENRILHLLLSDLHYGAALDGREVPIEYGVVQEARRTAQVFLEAASYKRDHRAETTLMIHLAGDIFQGDLGHDKRDGEPLTYQWADALWILLQGIQYVATQGFKKIVILCSTGNHGRDINRHEGRATRQKWDSHETKLYVALKIALATLPNVEVRIPLTPYVEWEAFGDAGFGTHGDTVLNIGYPGRSVNVGAATAHTNKVNMWRTRNGKKPFSLFYIGHVHIHTDTILNNGVKFISNGCLIPPDPYSISMGNFDNQCSQAMWEQVDGYMVGDRRPIEVDERTDKDASLERIIKPFPGVF